jgi:hypothetical protein
LEVILVLCTLCLRSTNTTANKAQKTKYKEKTTEHESVDLRSYEGVGF